MRPATYADRRIPRAREALKPAPEKPNGPGASVVTDCASPYGGPGGSVDPKKPAAGIVETAERIGKLCIVRGPFHRRSPFRVARIETTAAAARMKPHTIAAAVSRFTRSPYPPRMRPRGPGPH